MAFALYVFLSVNTRCGRVGQVGVAVDWSCGVRSVVAIPAQWVRRIDEHGVVATWAATVTELRVIVAQRAGGRVRTLQLQEVLAIDLICERAVDPASVARELVVGAHAIDDLSEIVIDDIGEVLAVLQPIGVIAVAVEPEVRIGTEILLVLYFKDRLIVLIRILVVRRNRSFEDRFVDVLGKK